MNGVFGFSAVVPGLKRVLPVCVRWRGIVLGGCLMVHMVSQDSAAQSSISLQKLLTNNMLYCCGNSWTIVHFIFPFSDREARIVRKHSRVHYSSKAESIKCRALYHVHS